MKKSGLLGTGILATALLTGCGGSSSGGGTSVSEYDLGAYEGRNVDTATLAGTWVAVGTGSNSSEGDGDSVSTSFAVKEFFIIKGDSPSNYKKSSCDTSADKTIESIGTEIQVDNFVGEVENNTRVVGVKSTSVSSGGFTSSETINLILIKISDSTDSFADLDASGSIGGNSAEYRDVPVSCFNQVRGTYTVNGHSTTFEELTFLSGSEITRYHGSTGFTDFYENFTGFSLTLDTDELGESVTYDLTVNSSQSEVLTFSASDNSNSVTGTLTITLP